MSNVFIKLNLTVNTLIHHYPMHSVKQCHKYY